MDVETLKDIRAGEGRASFCRNSINTGKYNVVTFFPLFLFSMVRRVPPLPTPDT